MGSQESPDYNALVEELNRIKLIMEATFEGWWEWDIVTNAVHYSPQWYSMLGYKKEDFPSSDTLWMDLMHPDDATVIPALQDEKIKTGKPWDLEFRMRAADGQYKWVLSRGSVIRRSVDGAPEKVVGIHIDLTEKKELEKLKESIELKEELLNGIIRLSVDDFTIYEFLKKRIACSPHFGNKVLKYTADDLGQLTDTEVKSLLHPGDISKITTHCTAVMTSDNGQTIECKFRIKNREGEYLWLQTMDTVYKSIEQDGIIKISGSVSNVQNLVDMESKIEQDIKFLEEIAFENSHMVRGPVSSILGLVELIKQNHVQSDIDKQLIEYMERAVVKMDKVIRDFSDNINRQLINKKK